MLILFTAMSCISLFPPNSLSSFIYTLITHWLQFVLSLYFCLWVLQWTVANHILRENWLFLPKRSSTAHTSSLWGEGSQTSYPSMLECSLMSSCTAIPSYCELTTAVLLSYLEDTVWSGLPWTLVLTIILPPRPRWSLILEKRGQYRLPIGAEYSRHRFSLSNQLGVSVLATIYCTKTSLMSSHSCKKWEFYPLVFSGTLSVAFETHTSPLNW